MGRAWHDPGVEQVPGAWGGGGGGAGTASVTQHQQAWAPCFLPDGVSK